MIPIPNFPDYFFCKKTLKVYSSKRNDLREVKPISLCPRKYIFYKEKDRIIVSIEEILKQTRNELRTN